MNWLFCKIKVRPSYGGGLSDRTDILLSVLTSSKKTLLVTTGYNRDWYW